MKACLQVGLVGESLTTSATVWTVQGGDNRGSHPLTPLIQLQLQQEHPPPFPGIAVGRRRVEERTAGVATPPSYLRRRTGQHG